MKAWLVCDNYDWVFRTVVFAKTSGKAKIAGMHSDQFVDAEFIDIRVKRCKKLDDAYHGNVELDWYDDNDRLRMVRDADFECFEDYDCEFCNECSANIYCGRYEDEKEV